MATAPKSNSKAGSRARRAERVAQMQADAARRERGRRLANAGLVVLAVVLVMVVLVVVKLSTNGNGSDNSSTGSSLASADLMKSITSVPASTFDAVGAGQASNDPRPISGASQLTKDGLPEVLFVGAEYCPYCAATRWGVIVALSRFGSFTGLGQTMSSGTDYAPNTPTLSFHGATYSSKYLTFAGYETEDRQGKNLDTLPADAEKTFATYDSPPYVPASSAEKIPFIDIGGKYLLDGSAFDPIILQGMTHEQIAAALSDSSSPVAKAIDGEANALTAAVCAITAQEPASVCSSQGVQAALSAING